MLVALIHACTYMASFAQGPKKAMDFIGSTSFEHINFGNNLSDTLDTVSFTMEMWIKFDVTNNGDPAFIGNKDWNSGANTGFAWAMTNSTTLRFNFRPAGGTRRDYNTTVSNLAGWNHIAMVVDRNGSLNAYINGVQTGTAINISGDAGKTLDGILPVRLGSDGTGAYNYNGVSRFNGKIDEFRIWKSVRTATQIRDLMCRSLKGNEADLFAYFNMDDTSTSVLKNMAPTGTRFDGAFQNAPVRVKSGAAIGDTSVYVYSSTWTGQSLQLSTPARGTITVDSFDGTGDFVQLYRILDTPEYKTGLTLYNNNNVYYGLVASSGLASYVKYDYNNYDSAKNYKEAISFFGRAFDDVTNWNLKSSLYNDTANKVLRTDSIRGNRQLFLANFIGTCKNPAQLSVSDITFNSAKLKWNTGGAAAWNIEYGPENFSQGSGTMVQNVVVNPYGIENLQPKTTYEFYVQDSCVGLGSSGWVGPFKFTTLSLPTFHQVGAGAAMNLGGNNWIDATGKGGAKDTFTALNMPVKDITVEVWVKPRQFGQWRAMVGFMQDNATFERGWDLETGDNNKFRFAISSQKTLRLNYMETGSSFETDQWYHVAGVYDGDTMRLYVNGILEAKSGSDSGNIAYDNSWLALGAYKDNDEFFPVRGSIDEIRIWNVARSQDDIRETMCRKLKGNESGLVKYFRLDSYEGTTAIEEVTGVHGELKGTLNDNWVVSGAAIGDTSVYVYNNLPTANLELNTGNRGKINVDSISTDAIGMQVYLVNDTPSYKNGIADLGTTDKYFGVFPARGNAAEYRVRYDYANYTNAVSNKANLRLYNRRDNEYTTWAIANIGNATANNVFSGKSYFGTRQYLLANFSALLCSGPSALSVGNIDTGNATVSWTSTSGNHQLQVGKLGFQLGNGTTIDSIFTNSYRITGLALGTPYEVYVKDSCAGTESAWVGPMYFQTVNPCVMQANGFADSIEANKVILKWTDAGTAPGYDISWGPKGFGNPNFGIQVNAGTTRHELSGLQPVTEYDFFVRSNCGANKTAWAGPFTFKTDTVKQVGIATVSSQGLNAIVYPNPASSVVNVSVDVDGKVEVAMFNMMGVQVYNAVMNERNKTIDVTALPAGVYYITLRHNEQQVTSKLLIQHQ